MENSVLNPPTFSLAPLGERRPSTRLYPDPATGLGRSWAAAWAELVTAGSDYLDGVELAERSAKVAGLSPNTMITLFTRAATAGVLEREHRSVAGTRGTRTRTFYRAPRA